MNKEINLVRADVRSRVPRPGNEKRGKCTKSEVKKKCNVQRRAAQGVTSHTRLQPCTCELQPRTTNNFAKMKSLAIILLALSWTQPRAKLMALLPFCLLL